MMGSKQMSRWYGWLVVVLIAGPGLCLNAHAAPGDALAVVPVAQASGLGVGIGIAVDCDNPPTLYYTNTFDPTLYRMDASGADLGSVPITDAAGAPISLGAITWDNTRQMIWGGTDNSGIPVKVYLVNPRTGAATLQFTAQSSGCCGFCDGIAYDASDDSVYVTDDVARVIDQHDASSGAWIRTLAPTNAAGDTLGGTISGVLVGAGDLLYLGRSGFREIVQVKKSDGSFIGSFASPGGRDEDLECDRLSFPGKTAIWSKDPFNDMVTAIEVEPDTCECGGGEEPRPIPTVSGWGFATLGLLLLVGGRAYFHRRRNVAAT